MEWTPPETKLVDIPAEDIVDVDQDDDDWDDRLYNHKGDRIWQAGDKIEGNFNAEGVWYAGTVTRVNSDGTYNIDYADGDKEEEVRVDKLAD